MLLAAELFSGALFRSLKLGLKIMALWTWPPPHRKPGAERGKSSSYPWAAAPATSLSSSLCLGKAWRGARLWLGQQGWLQGSCVTLNSCRLGALGSETPPFVHSDSDTSVAHFKLQQDF